MKPQTTNFVSPEFTLADHTALFERVAHRAITIDEIRAAFESWVCSAASVRAELTKLTKKELTKLIDGPVYSDEKKATYVRMAHKSLTTSFLWLTAGDTKFMSYNPLGDLDAQVRAALADLTPDRLETFVTAREERAAEWKARRDAAVAAIKEPQTLDDFDMFFRVRGRDALTPEQEERYDALYAAKVREDSATKPRSDPPAANAPVSQVAAPETIVDGPVKVIRTTHTQRGHTIYVAQLGDRVSRDEYIRLLGEAKRLGGYYSKFSKNGAIPGFIFSDEQSARNFASIAAPSAVNEQAVAEQPAALPLASTPYQKPGDGVRLMASAIREQAKADLGRDRLDNTARRARMAAAAERQANDQLSLADTLDNLGDAIDAGKAVYLQALGTRVQVEALMRIIRRAHYDRQRAMGMSYAETLKDTDPTLDDVFFVEWSTFKASAEMLRHLYGQFRSLPGGKRFAAKFLKLAEGLPEDMTATVPESDAAKTVKLAGKDRAYVWVWAEDLATLGRLRRMGITCAEQLRMACRELIPLMGERRQLDPVKEAERRLAGQVVGDDFFPTPKGLCVRMVELAEVAPGSFALEPSAGNGHIAEALRDAGATVDVCEISATLREILALKGFRAVAEDFVSFVRGIRVPLTYDAIVMNPPFSNERDRFHIKLAYQYCLADGGRLVAIAGEGAFSDGSFVEWLEQHGAHVEKLPVGTFNHPSLTSRTSANARLIVLTK